MTVRDVNIGIPPVPVYNVKVDAAVIKALKDVVDEIEATTEELGKIRVGQELILGQEIEEE